MEQSKLRVGGLYLVKIGEEVAPYRVKAIVEVDTGPIALRGHTYIVEHLDTGKRRIIYGAYHFVREYGRCKRCHENIQDCTC